jgi:hypothetical protein
MSDNCNDIVKEKTNGILGNIKTSQVNIYDGSALPALPSIISGTSSLNDVILAISQELTDINTAISNITFTSDVVTYEGSFSGCFTLTNGDSITDVIDDLAQEICNTQALITTSEIKDTQVSMSAGITIPCWVSAPGPYNYLDDFSDAISDAMCSALSSITTIQNTYATTSTVEDTLDAAFDNFVTQGFVNSNVGLLATIGSGTAVTKGKLNTFAGGTATLIASSDNYIYFNSLTNTVANNATTIGGPTPGILATEQYLYKLTTGAVSVSSSTDLRNYSIMNINNVKTDRIQDLAITTNKLENFGTAGTYAFPTSIIIDAKGRVQSVTSDINITSPANNDILYYDTGASEWINGSIYNVIGFGTPSTFAKYDLSGELTSGSVVLTDIVEFATLGPSFNRATIMYDSTASGYINKSAFNRVRLLATASTTLDERVIGVDTTSGAIVVTIPNAASQLPGELTIIKDEANNCAVNNCTIQANMGSLIDGAATYVLTNNGESVILYSDGSEYYVV